MRTVAVIPARLASTRLERKALREIAGKLLIGWVYEAVRSSPLLRDGDVIIATDSGEIMQACKRHGWKAQMTSSAHRSGTERVHEIAQSVAADVYLNVQGDEPMTRAEHIAGLIEVMQDPAVQVGTLMTAAAPADIDQSQRSKGSGGSGWTGPIFLAGDHSLRPRWRRAQVFQTSRLLCLSQTRTGPFRRAARVFTRAQRAPGAIALPGERNRDSRGRDPVRYCGGGHGGRFAPRGKDSRFTFLSSHERASPPLPLF